MTDKAKDDQYSEKETMRRREATLKRMLATPPTPHKVIGKKAASQGSRAKTRQKR